jgi:glutathione synthase/RimK-type ligase-like ATP-grasp enzyme
MHVHLLTCAELPDLYPDDHVLRDKLEKDGHRVTVGVWTEEVPTTPSTVVVIRSCWDYYKEPVKFIDRLNDIGQYVPVWNPPRLFQWNSDKVYLDDLPHFRRPDHSDLLSRPSKHERYFPDWECDEFIVKPRVSNAGNGVVRLPAMSLDQVCAAAPDFDQQGDDPAVRQGDRRGRRVLDGLHRR